MKLLNRVIIIGMLMGAIAFWMVVLLYVLLWSTSAMAVDFEAEIGHDKFQETQNGIWYQKGFPYNWNTNSTSFKLGLSGYVYSDIRYHVGYTDLGKITLDSYATPSDANYNGVNGCVGKCWPLAHISGSTSMRGVYGLLAPEFTFGEFKAFVEMGAWYYHMSSTINVGNFYSSPMATPTSLSIAYQGGNRFDSVIGAGVQYNRWQFVLERIGTKLYNSPNYEPAMGDYALNAGIRYLF